MKSAQASPLDSTALRSLMAGAVMDLSVYHEHLWWLSLLAIAAWCCAVRQTNSGREAWAAGFAFGIGSSTGIAFAMHAVVNETWAKFVLSSVLLLFLSIGHALVAVASRRLLSRSWPCWNSVSVMCFLWETCADRILRLGADCTIDPVRFAIPLVSSPLSRFASLGGLPLVSFVGVAVSGAVVDLCPVGQHKASALLFLGLCLIVLVGIWHGDRSVHGPVDSIRVAVLSEQFPRGANELSSIKLPYALAVWPEGASRRSLC